VPRRAERGHSLAHSHTHLPCTGTLCNRFNDTPAPTPHTTHTHTILHTNTSNKETHIFVRRRNSRDAKGHDDEANRPIRSPHRCGSLSTQSQLLPLPTSTGHPKANRQVDDKYDVLINFTPLFSHNILSRLSFVPSHSPSGHSHGCGEVDS
jgi:hypothetical protein